MSKICYAVLFFGILVGSYAGEKKASGRLIKTEQVHGELIKNVRLVYWKPTESLMQKKQNFGDYLSTVVVKKVLRNNKMKLCEDRRLVESRATLLGIGSILAFAQTNDTIWGSGVNGKSLNFKFSGLDVRAVRGPLTRQILKKRGIKVPEIYGDPALLLPILFPRMFKKSPKPKYPYFIVPNLNDLEFVQNFLKIESKLIISPLLRWDKVVRRILEAEFIISSSLHGLVVAEAYGIPARWIKFQDYEKPIKYHDYFLGTGRNDTRFAKTIYQALEMGGAEPIRNWDYNPLLNAFPIDLWNTSCNQLLLT